MAKDIEITVVNELETEKRGINVYHHFSRSAHIISHGNSIAVPLGTAETGDYLHLSVVRGPGNLWKNCLIRLPLWIDAEFSTEGRVTLIHFNDGFLFKIPPGPPTWQLKVTRSSQSRLTQKTVHVIIGGDEQDL